VKASWILIVSRFVLHADDALPDAGSEQRLRPAGMSQRIVGAERDHEKQQQGEAPGGSSHASKTPQSRQSFRKATKRPIFAP
jgi:hypothetical protein